MEAKRGRKKPFHTGARRGSKPLPTLVREKRGNSSHKSTHGDPARKYERIDGSDLKPPIPLSGRELQLWKQLSRMAPWITDLDKSLFLTFVKLSVKQETGKLSAAALREYRILGSSLGLDPTSRSRPLTVEDEPPSSSNGVNSNPFGYSEEIVRKAPMLARLGLIGKPGHFDKRNRDDCS